jgi:hypothetical protein
MLKKYVFATLTLCPFLHADNAQELVAFMLGGTIVTGTAFWAAGRLAYGPIIVSSAQTRFAPEMAQLNTFGWYANNGYGWNAAYEQQLRDSIKNQVIQFHNMNRDKWRITVIYDLWHGIPADNIATRYYHYPLMQYMHDLDWYIHRLRVIHALRLHSDRDAVATLLYQLTYILNLMRSDIDLNREEQLFQQERLARQMHQVQQDTLQTIQQQQVGY